MSGVAGACIGISEVQPVIGDYVQDADEPTADTNYIGVNVLDAWRTAYNVNEDVAAGFVCPTNDGTVPGGEAQYVVAGETITEGDDVAITDGVASVDNTTGTHAQHVIGGVLTGQYFWAVAI